MPLECFRYGGYDVDAATGVLTCRYELDDWRFEERIDFGPGHTWTPAAYEAARLVALLAGVSYYKAGAPPHIDLGALAVRPNEAEFLRTFYLDGLGEYAFKNGLDLDVTITGGRSPGPTVSAPVDPARPLIPFGGGLDSLVTVELVRAKFADAALFVVSRDHLDVIARAADAPGLPLLRVGRQLDPQILRSTELGFLNGHVPVTGILSAIAVCAAILDGRGAVVMSNEWSASVATREVDGRPVNHQYSKSAAFEDGFRRVLAGAVGPEFAYFSELRPFSELWIASRFACDADYFGVFHSCNRAFHIDPAKRQVEWCGRCDKCCFIDLILSPFASATQLRDVFGGSEPLEDPSLLDQFRTLLAVPGVTKPFECVGDTEECRAAVMLAAQREDRHDNETLRALRAELGAAGDRALADVPRLLSPMGDHHVPDAFFPAL